jgi:tRNA(Ile)-lysidine synthase
MTIAESVAKVLNTEFGPIQRETGDGAGATSRSTVLVAVSGGADSTALLLALCEPPGRDRIRIVACHFDHGLRAPAEHAADLLSIGGICGGLGVPLLVDRASPGAIRALAAIQRSGIESAARSLRYRFFESAARMVGAGWIFTGHTEDDQVETVLMALGRGADPLSFSGIPARRVHGDGLVLLRPLLTVRKEQIVAFLRERGVAWSEDSSNADPSFERNRVRNEVLPEMEGSLPGFRTTILALQRSSASRRTEAEQEAQALIWETAGEQSWLDAEAFFSASRAARLVSLFEQARRRGMIRPSSRISVRFFAPLLGPRPPAGIIIEGRGSRIRLQGARLVWSTDIVRPTDYGYLRSVTLGVAVELPTGPAITVYPGEKETTDRQLIVIELKEVREPLFVRSHRIGDDIRTAGGHKSVASLLVELHVPPRLRHQVPVICDREGVVAVLADGYGSGRNIAARREPSDGVTCTVAIRGDNTDV